MNVLVSTDDNYLMPLIVLLQSIFDNCRCPVTFYLLVSGLSVGNRQFLKDYVEGHNGTIVFCPVSEDVFAGLPTKKYITRETYFRLLAAEVLPHDLNKILWLDADMIVCGDIADLYDIDMGDMAVAACSHGEMMRQIAEENCHNIGISHPEQYFNAGMMLCNLDKWRKMDIPGRIGDILSSPHKFMFPGQDLTNLIFNGEVVTLPWEKYNCMTHCISKENFTAIENEARIIHFAGTAKPWKFRDLPFTERWDVFYTRSPYGSKALRRASYFQMKAIFDKTGGGLK